MLLPLLPILLATSPLEQTLPVEDEAHRLDRMQTRLLNERAAARLGRGLPAVAPAQAAGSGGTAGEGQSLREREERAIARWRPRAAPHRPRRAASKARER